MYSQLNSKNTRSYMHKTLLKPMTILTQSLNSRAGTTMTSTTIETNTM